MDSYKDFQKMQGPRNKVAMDRSKTTSERLDELNSKVEALIQDRGRLVVGIQSALDKISNLNGKTAEVVDALVHALGDEFRPKLDSSIRFKRDERAAKLAAHQKAELEELLKANKIKPVNLISHQSLLVGRMFDKDGNVVHPGRSQLEFQDLHDNLQPEYLGKPVGSVLPAADGYSFELLEVYEASPPAEATPAPVADENAPLPSTVTEGA